MIYPATYNITILQNSTWYGVFRATDDRRTVSAVAVNTGVPTFTSDCHGYAAGDRVVLTGDTPSHCGLELNTVYYVISADLTTDTFKLSSTEGGASITVDDDNFGTLYVARPLDLSGYTVDADIISTSSGLQIGTFDCSLVDPTNGSFSLTLDPATTEAFDAGTYQYDVSLTNDIGHRYYWLTGAATVQRTYSRS